MNRLIFLVLMLSCVNVWGQRPVEPLGSGVMLSNRGGGVELPYPMLFVHGLNGNAGSWSEMSEWLSTAVGGAVDLEFCLNGDGYQSISDLEDDLVSFMPAILQPANLYIVNFNCTSGGTCSSASSVSGYSNQSGIYKQGEAIGMAISKVLQSTGKSKVILVGHSMGGVACREYLQNEEHWGAASHRVAKLLTSGSPHVGFDLGSKIFKDGALLQGIDTDSEAVRDLKNRHTGFLEWVPGVFFWGGLEDQDYMYDDIFYWHNVDCNSNGVVGETVLGLNERNMPNDLEFSSLWDTYDLVVTPEGASYNFTGEYSGGENLCSVLSNGWNGEFHCESWGWDVPGGVTLGHNELPEQLLETLWALDEADDYVNSYDVDEGVVYTGFITPQADNGPYLDDWDDYLLTVSESGTLTVTASFSEEALGSDMYVYNVATGQYIASLSQVAADEFLEVGVGPGQYIVEFSGNVSEDELLGQYWFMCEVSQPSTVQGAECPGASVFPNPSTGFVSVGTRLGDAPQPIEIYDLRGSLVWEGSAQGSEPLDLGSLEPGRYMVRTEACGRQHTLPLLMMD